MLAYALTFNELTDRFRAEIAEFPDGTEVKFVARGQVSSWNWSAQDDGPPQTFTGWLGESHRCVASDAPAIARLWNHTLRENPDPFDPESRFEVLDFDPTSICAAEVS